MKKKLVIATVAMVLLFSSVISVVGLRAFVRDMSRADYIRSLAYERARAEYALGQQAPEAAAPVEEPRAPGGQPTAPRRGGRGAPPPTAAPGPDRPSTIPVDAPQYEDRFPEFDVELWRRSRDAVRLGQDLTVAPGDVVRDAIVVFGNATIAGRVTGDLRVFFGTARILSTAVIDGDFITVGGGANVQPGATARRDVVVIGGPLDAPAGFVAGGQQVVIGSGLLGGWLDAAVPYLSRGLLWGRVIVPGLPWIWGIVALFFLLYAALNLIFDRPVRACALTMRDRPLTTFGTGLLVLLLIGPVCVLLAFSIIGIAVVPFVICAAIAGALIGKVSVARFIGMMAVEEDPDGNRAHAARSFVIGFAVLTIAYMIPVLGLITWAIAGVLGLGSVWLTFMAAYRRENPAKPPAMMPQPPMAPPPLAPPPAPAYSFSTPAADASSTAFDGSAAATPTAPPPYQAPPTPPQGGYAAYAPAGYGYAASGLLVAQPRALFRDRLASFIVDVVVIFIAVAFLDAINMLDTPAFFPLLLIYFIVFWTWKQTTFGGIICQIRLVKTDGTPLSFADSLVRGLAGIFSLGVFAIGALWILRDPERQAWHDKIAGTYVVKVPRTFPL
jgi:uncharacterized RDD family membrane protein YckC